jgi:1-acyl-sn-glycerol-3-phosphate acyltransferase
VIPCHVSGAFHAFPPAARWPRPGKILLRIGEPLVFDSVPNRRTGWEEISTRTQEAVRRLGKAGVEDIGMSDARHDA